MPMTTRWLLDNGEVKITIRAKSDAASQLVAVALSGMPARQVSKGQGIRLTVSGKPEEWRLHDHSTDIKRKLTNTGDLIYHLTDRIIFHIADQVKQRHCLHAAAVGHGIGALVIPANSGAGKSTFTTWLVANGFDYITDELILIDDQKRLEGVARPIQIKPHGIDAVEHLLEGDKTYYPGKLANAIPISSLGGNRYQPVDDADAAHDLKLMIFPTYRKASEFSFERLSSADAGMRLMANHVNARNLEGHGFKAMMETIRSTPCYALEYGGFNRLPSDFPDQLRTLLSS